MIIHALAIFLFLPNFIHGQVKTCASRQYSSSTVCVCNSTYCDEFPPLGQLADGQAAVYTSSKSGKRFERTTLNFGSAQAQSPTQFTVDISKQAQKIIGFGGAITDSAVINFFNLSAAAQTNLINAYYGDAGIGYTVGRMPIAASDFTDREYNYANVSGDFNLTNFALAYEDFQFRIPFIKMAQALIGSKLKLFGSPWGPPGWLKTSGLQHGCASLIGNPGDMYYQTWANYFIRFFEEYAKQGIPFWGLTVQNEPNVCGSSPSLVYNSGQEGGFVKLNLGPTIRNNEVTKKLKIMIFDTSRSLMPNYPNDILKDPETSKYVDGIGIHWYHDTQNIHAPTPPSVITEVHDANPDKFLMVTEACAGWFGYEGRHGVDLGNWSRGERYAQDAIENLNYWGSGWTDWNMILDTQGGPSWVGNKADSPIIVNATSDEFYKQPMFYALGHLSKFLVENSTKVQLDVQGIDVSSNTSLMDAVALITPSNQRVLVINNRASSNYSIAIKDTSIPGSQLALNIESNSMTTFIWSGCGCPSTGNWFPSRTNPCNCYSLVQTPSNWISANNYCQQQDPKATLVSIDSAFENSALLGSLQNQTSCSQAFIGLEQQNNAWTWINNDPSTYRNWRAGYPISNRNDKYVQLNTKDGAWTNIDDTVSGCYLCEVKTSA